MLEQTLQETGLSKNEARVYLALLEGPMHIGEISAKTKIHRRNIYDSLETLKGKGLISSTVINNRNLFEAANPKRIIELLDEKKYRIETEIPVLLAKQNRKPSSVRVFFGSSGRKLVFEDKLNYPSEQLVLGAHEPSQKTGSFIEKYHLRRVKKKIPLKMLFACNEKDAAKRLRKFGLIKARLLPESFDSPIAINIYGNKVALLLGSGTVEPITILIEDKFLSQDFKNYFNLLWKISKSF